MNEGDWSYAEPRRADGEREEEEQEMEERDRWGAVEGQAHGDGCQDVNHVPRREGK